MQNLSAFGYFKRAVTERYADFKGRSRRSEYWFFTLFSMIILLPAYFIGVAGAASESGALTAIGFGIYGLGALALIVPSLAVAVRRLHDTGRSGWWYLIGLVPIIGSIVLLVFFCTDSEPGANQWGPNPKTGEADVIDHLQTTA